MAMANAGMSNQGKKEKWMTRMGLIMILETRDLEEDMCYGRDVETENGNTG